MDMWKWLTPYRKVFWSSVAMGGAIMLAFFAIATWHGYERGDFFSFVNLIVDVVVMPATLIALMVAIHELRKSQAKPDVDLFFEGNVKEAKLIKGHHSHGSLPKFVLLNSGNAIARWYSVEIDAPIPIRPELGHVLESDPNRWSRRRWPISFRSGGIDVVYLNHPFPLTRALSVRFRDDMDYQKQYEISYVIANDWGDVKRGQLIVRVVDEKA